MPPVVLVLTLERRRSRLAAFLVELKKTRVLEELNAELRVVLGWDGNKAAQDAMVPQGDADAFEKCMPEGTSIYRGWPVTEEEDAERALASVARDVSVDDGDSAWIRYERRFTKNWHADRARYFDFHCRRLTSGDVGCALAHIRAWDIAAAGAGSPTIIFEDDALPKAGLGESLARELAALEGIGWDLVHVHSARYSRRLDRPLQRSDYSGSLLVSEHRKLLDAYILSPTGAKKLSESQFRACILPVDDFVPALYSAHPRADVEALPCVQRVRDQGFTALTYSDDAAQAVVGNRHVGSDSNFAFLVMGDYGVSTDVAAHVSKPTRKEHECNPIPDSALIEFGEGTAQNAASLALSRHGFAVIRLPIRVDGDPFTNPLVRAIADTEALWWAFFETATKERKQRLVGKGGRAGPTKELLCHGCGYSRQRLREQYHCVMGAWPKEGGNDPYAMPDSAIFEASLRLGELMRELALSILDVLDAGMRERWEDAVRSRGDASVLDIFSYDNDNATPADLCNMSHHTDPGLLTLTSSSVTPGLEVQDASTGAWIAVELHSTPFDIVVMAADELSERSGGAVPSCNHRVAGAHTRRVSIVYELRL